MNIKIGDVYKGIVNNETIKVVNIKLENCKWYIYFEDENKNVYHTTDKHFEHLLFERV